MQFNSKKITSLSVKFTFVFFFEFSFLIISTVEGNNEKLIYRVLESFCWKRLFKLLSLLITKIKKKISIAVVFWNSYEYKFSCNTMLMKNNLVSHCKKKKKKIPMKIILAHPLIFNKIRAPCSSSCSRLNDKSKGKY